MPGYTDPMVAIEPQQAAPAGSVAAADTYAMPATQGQVRFWSLDQLNPGNPALNMPLMWKFSGPLDRNALLRAFARTIERHETLRTTFDLIDGKLLQIIHPPAPINIPMLDLAHLDPALQAPEANHLAREHAAVRMDLRRGPLLDLKLLRFEEQHHLLLVTMHHIICDGISNGILLRDMASFYEEESAGRNAMLPELPIQFADFAVWQQEWLASGEAARSLDFWRKSLGNDFCRISLPRDADARAALPDHLNGFTGNIETLLIPPALQAQAHAFCIRENVTLNILLFSIFVALLHRLTGEDDLTIGSPCANRTEETEELIGLFMNIQVMRLRLEKDISFRSLLGKVQDWTLGAYENQELPFENLVHDPFFSRGSNSFEIPVFFLYQKSFMLSHRIGPLEIVPLRSESPGAVFEMMFAIVDRAEEGPRLQLEYNPRYFKTSTIERYLRMFVELLASAVSAPETCVADLPIPPPAEREHLLTAWNGTAVDFGPFEPVSAAFLRRAELDPEGVALECGNVLWTNSQLAAYARTLAARLLDAGLAPGSLCGIAVERSPEMLGAVLAVMMTGAAYVPLDPRHPKERLEAVLGDAGAALLLTSRDLELQIKARVLRLDHAVPRDETSADKALPVSPGPEDLAYVIYTSGSTGKPKGVAVQHAALVNLLRSMQRSPGLNEHDTLVAITTLAFDIAGLELLLPLVTGARLVIATDAEVLDGRQLLALLGRTKATVMQATPGAWRLLLDAGWEAVRSSNRPPFKALCGGEALPRGLADSMLERASEVWNMYGPTETTIWSSATRVHKARNGETGALRLGVPIANTEFHVLDAHHQLVPAGVTGELFIGGAGLAQGYWQRPELTAEKFILNPLVRAGNPGRLYATGDLARRHEDGTLELLGRNDFQVKVRGYRIELPEIEAALMLHPQVREAVVMQQQSDSTGVTRLAAYLVAGTTDARASDNLIARINESLTHTLPDYMRPNAYIILPALPRNSNGKIDRRALPSADAASDSGIHSTAAEPDQYYPPADAIERQLADIWQTTLGLERISVRASFFSLGVGSLAALRLITKMNRVYGTDLGLASLITASTIQSIAELIHTRFAPNTTSSVVPLKPEGTRPPLFILHGIGGNVVNFYGLAMRIGRDQPVYGIQSQALLGNQSALLHLKDMAAHYLADIRKVQPHGPYHLLGYSFGGTVVLEMAHQLRAAGQPVALLGMIDSKSKDYDETLAHLNNVQARIGKRVTRFRGNTDALGWGERAAYIGDKVKTRTIRFASMAAARLRFRRVPAFMRSAYDINYVAVQNYKPQPFDGKLVLFRATEQDDAGAPHDLGWGKLFAQGVEIHDLPGDHERIFLEPNIDDLTRSLERCLVQK